ncbi:hypothetical protein FA95DRAFT_1578562 [Auriscalpium vulgare]|uniref:Uncharacterized protein n=1 Tax=Auriscalpium vulgare TaxID=40419 RepID=A0ACB8R1T7_9AGAM|nr:hypothetical protein FA95DRAFT_1578562 [Auriscalpium vulgare]
MANGTRARVRKANSVNIPTGTNAPKNKQAANASAVNIPTDAQQEATEANDTPPKEDQQPPESPLSEPDDDMDVDPKGKQAPLEGEGPITPKEPQFTSAYASKNPFETLGNDTEGPDTSALNADQPTQGTSPIPEDAHGTGHTTEPTTPAPDPTPAHAPTPAPATAPATPTHPPQQTAQGPKVFFAGEDTTNWAPGAREHFAEVQKGKFTFERTEHFLNAASVGRAPNGEVLFTSDTVGGDHLGRETPRPHKRARPEPEPEAPSSPPQAPDTPTPPARRRATPQPKDSAPTAPPPAKAASAKDFLAQISFSKARAPLKASSQTTAEPPLKIFTSGPFPPIYDSHAAAPLDHVDKGQVAEWWSINTTKLLLRVFGKETQDPKNLATLAARMVAMISEGFGEEDPLIAAPLPATEDEPNPRAPSTFLLHGISEETADMALGMGILDTKEITVQVLPFKLRNPALVLLIEGFSTTRVELIRTVVDKTWRSDASGARLMQFIADSEGEDAPLTVQQVTNFIASVRIIRIDMKGAGSLLIPHFAVIAEPDTIHSLTHWVTLRDHFAELTYRSNMVGTGSVIPYLDCPLCHGCDHPRGLCPFPHVPGWQGPGNKAEFTPKATRGRGGSRGGARGGRTRNGPYDDSRDGARRGRRY